MATSKAYTNTVFKIQNVYNMKRPERRNIDKFMARSKLIKYSSSNANAQRPSVISITNT